MKKPLLILSLATSLMAISGLSHSSSDESPGELLQRLGGGNAAAGRLKSATHLCQECHAADGNSLSSGVPSLSGHPTSYLFKQLKNFQSGERDHPTMNAMASGVSDSDLADIAAYFSSQPRTASVTPKSIPIAKELFNNGDWQRNILACKTCHGLNGRGNGTAAYPLIGGQQQIYLREQLRNWRAGSRKNSEGDVMNQIAQKLTDEEIESLASYISGL